MCRCRCFQGQAKREGEAHYLGCARGIHNYFCSILADVVQSTMNRSRVIQLLTPKCFVFADVLLPFLEFSAVQIKSLSGYCQ